MTKKLISIIISILLLVLMFGCIKSNQMIPTNKDVIVEQSADFNLANTLQFNNYVPLTVFEGQLYFYSCASVDSEYAKTLSVFSDGGVKKIGNF